MSAQNRAVLLGMRVSAWHRVEPTRMMKGLFLKIELPAAADALPGRTVSMPVSDTHRVTGMPMAGPFAESLETALFALGCFWQAERVFWQLSGVHTTAVGYAGGHTPNPTYDEVCTGMTGHSEVVRVVFDPKVISFERLLKVFWASHDPTQGMQQGPDRGTQYRSALYCCNDRQLIAAEASRHAYQRSLENRGLGTVTTEIRRAPRFYFAEAAHQQYLYRHDDTERPVRGMGIGRVVEMSDAGNRIHEGVSA